MKIMSLLQLKSTQRIQQCECKMWVTSYKRQMFFFLGGGIPLVNMPSPLSTP